jgi:hypothetical protein
MKENVISPVLQMLKAGVKSKQPNKELTRKRLFVFRFIKYGCAVLWWGFLVYLLFKYFS